MHADGRHTTNRGQTPKWVFSLLNRRTIRIDDENNPDFWLHLEFSDADILKLSNSNSSFNLMQAQVLEFHKKFGHVVGDTPAIRRSLLRSNLIEEEAEETVDAIRQGNLVETVDGLCDLLYVCFGAAIEFGVNLQPFFDEVHRSNMAKEGGATREDGKTIKPPGWVPPDIRSLLIAAGWIPPAGRQT